LFKLHKGDPPKRRNLSKLIWNPEQKGEIVWKILKEKIWKRKKASPLGKTDRVVMCLNYRVTCNNIPKKGSFWRRAKQSRGEGTKTGRGGGRGPMVKNSKVRPGCLNGYGSLLKNCLELGKVVRNQTSPAGPKTKAHKFTQRRISKTQEPKKKCHHSRTNPDTAPTTRTDGLRLVKKRNF